MDDTNFVESQSSSDPPPGPRNLPSSVTSSSSTFGYFFCVWGEELREMLVMEANQNVIYVGEHRPTSYCAKYFQAVTISEMKVFLVVEWLWRL